MTTQSAPRLTRPEQQSQTRERLIEAAEALILNQSIPGLSLRAVCAQAGFSQGAFYSNFADKDELLLAVVNRHASKERDSLQQSLAGLEGNSLQQSLDAIAGWLSGMSRRREWARLSVELKLQAIRDEDFAARLSAAWSPIIDEFAAIIRRLAARHGLTPALPPEVVAATLAVLWNTISLHDERSACAHSANEVFLAVLCGMLMPASHGAPTDPGRQGEPR